MRQFWKQKKASQVSSNSNLFKASVPPKQTEMLARIPFLSIGLASTLALFVAIICFQFSDQRIRTLSEWIDDRPLTVHLFQVTSLLASAALVPLVWSLTKQQADADKTTLPIVSRASAVSISVFMVATTLAPFESFPKLHSVVALVMMVSFLTLEFSLSLFLGKSAFLLVTRLYIASFSSLLCLALTAFYTWGDPIDILTFLKTEWVGATEISLFMLATLFLCTLSHESTGHVSGIPRSPFPPPRHLIPLEAPPPVRRTPAVSGPRLAYVRAPLRTERHYEHFMVQGLVLIDLFPVLVAHIRSWRAEDSAPEPQLHDLDVYLPELVRLGWAFLGLLTYMLVSRASRRQISPKAQVMERLASLTQWSFVVFAPGSMWPFAALSVVQLCRSYQHEQSTKRIVQFASIVTAIPSFFFLANGQMAGGIALAQVVLATHASAVDILTEFGRPTSGPMPKRANLVASLPRGHRTRGQRLDALLFPSETYL